MLNRKSTFSGDLAYIPDCEIVIPGAGSPIRMRSLPDISDSKSAVYNSEGIIGRSFPLYTYSHSADRSLNIQIHFFIINQGDGERNLADLRKIQSALYPRPGGDLGVPYKPPPICTIKCGKLLAQTPVCAILQSYSVKFPTEVAWDEDTYCPYRFDVDTNWLVVYTSSTLPFQEQIITAGY
jgi:hypothetical protein